MINQCHCPICKAPASKGCSHLAVAAEGRDFVRRCVELAHAEIPWRVLCRQRKAGEWPHEPQDFTWLETAFCEEFLKPLSSYEGMEHEWRSGPKLSQGGFWVLLWSRSPQHLWWELREEIEGKSLRVPVRAEAAPWLIWLNPR